MRSFTRKIPEFGCKGRVGGCKDKKKGGFSVKIEATAKQLPRKEDDYASCRFANVRILSLIDENQLILFLLNRRIGLQFLV
jgi:hypothetical protein